MKKKRTGAGSAERGSFGVRCAVCAVLLLGAVAAKSFGNGEFYDALLYNLSEGASLRDIVEVFGQSPADAEAWRELWSDAVAEPVGRVLGEGE